MRNLLLAGSLLALLGSALVAQADAPAQRLLERGRERMASAQTLQADMVLVLDGGDSGTARVQLMKPNLLRIELKGPRETAQFVSQGKAALLVLHKARRYVSLPLAEGAGGLPAAAALFPLVEAFFAPDTLRMTRPVRALAPMGVATGVGHEEYRGVELSEGEAGGVGRWYLNEAGVPAGAVLREGSVRSIWFQNVRLDRPMKMKEFSVRIPRGFKPL